MRFWCQYIDLYNAAKTCCLESAISIGLIKYYARISFQYPGLLQNYRFTINKKYIKLPVIFNDLLFKANFFKLSY